MLLRGVAALLCFAPLAACARPALAHAAPQPPDPFTEALHISRGEAVDLDIAAIPNVPNVYVFYSATSSADRALVENLVSRRRGSDQVGLHLIRLSSLDTPAARQHKVTETPLVVVRDRFGHELARTSVIDEIFPAVVKGIKTARLEWVDEADPKAAEVYKNLGAGKIGVASILKTMSLQPEWMDAIDRLSRISIFADNTALPRRLKEMIATYVSGINRCKY